MITKAKMALCASVAAAFALTALAAGAQDYSAATGSDVGGLTVTAPRSFARQPTTGARVALDQVSMTVPIGDLDLSNRHDARIAKRRIEMAARDVCDRAEATYPGDGEVAGGCEATAVRDALGQAQDAAGYPIVAWGYH